MYNVINFLISFGALQGFIIGVFLLQKGFRQKQEIVYLALILIGFAAILGRVIIIGIFENESLFFINLNFILLFSPALFLFAKEFAGTAQRISTFNTKHFLPFLIVNTGYILFLPERLD